MKKALLDIAMALAATSIIGLTFLIVITITK